MRKRLKNRIIFPKDFLWGAATSAHQVEGGNIWNDWHDFEKAGKVRNKEVSGSASDHYHKYEEDFKLAEDMHHSCHRMSIEWSRLEKKKGIFDQVEIEHYRKVLQVLKKKGLVTFVTLHHFTSPKWFEAEGGWSNPNSPQYFKEYTEKIVKELGEYIDFWITVNEPTLYIWHQYLLADRPPQKRSLKLANKAFRNYVNAHIESYQSIHQKIPKAKVGIANNFICYGIPYIPYVPVLNPILELVSHFWNYSYLNQIKKYQDFVGVNYYTATRLMQLDFSARMRADGEASRANLKGWKIYPEGIYFILMRVWHRYKKPIYITENGLPNKDDSVRRYYIDGNLSYVHQAIKKGANIKGYMHWSLLDNFEWDYGFEPRFGLIEVDYKTQDRTPRPSAKYYGEICRNGVIESEYSFREII